jgi:hypothetical protein
MSKKDTKKSGDTVEKTSSKINDGMCCRCTRRKEKKCKLTNKYVPRKHKCDATTKSGKIGFTYKD